MRAKASGRHGLEGRLRTGIGLTVAMQAISALDQLQPVPALGPVGEIRLVPDLDTFRVLPYAPHAGAVLTDHITREGPPAAVCQRSFLKRMEAALAAHDLTLRAAFETEFSLATKLDGAYVPDRLVAVLLDHRDHRVAGLRRRPRRRAGRAAHPGRAVLRRARPRAARDLDPARARAPGRRRAAARARDHPRRRHRAGAGRLAGAQALAGQRRQRRPHPLLALGRRAQPVLRRRHARPTVKHRPRVHRRRARAPPRPLRPDRSELQLLPPDRAPVLGRRVRLLGLRQPRGAGAGGIDLRAASRRRRPTPS